MHREDQSAHADETRTPHAGHDAQDLRRSPTGDGEGERERGSEEEPGGIGRVTGGKRRERHVSGVQLDGRPLTFEDRLRERRSQARE